MVTSRWVALAGPTVMGAVAAEVNEPLEAEISRERFEGERFGAGQKVGLRFRRWQVYPAGGAAA